MREPHTQATVRRFEVVHDRVFHLFIVSRELEYFAHVHPKLHANGSLDVDVQLPRAGVYQMIADFMPVGGSPQLVQKSIVTAGYTDSLLSIPHLARDTADKIVRDTRVKLTIPEPLAGREPLITFDLQDVATGAPVSDLEPYLGAAGHLISVRPDTSSRCGRTPPAGQRRPGCRGAQSSCRGGVVHSSRRRDPCVRRRPAVPEPQFHGGRRCDAIQAPANAKLAPPRYYMLFLVNNAGVPSVASFVHFSAPGVDTVPPTAPTGLTSQGFIGSATLSWDASTDNTGVALYNVHRSTTPGFQPSTSNRIAQPASTSATDTGVAAGTYFYVVTAQDIAGNVSGPSNEASVTVLADTIAPSVAMTAPAQLETVSGSVPVSATASDDVGEAGVQLQLDGQPLGIERTTPPYSVTWNTATTSNGSHSLMAVARDAANNRSEATVDVVVSNTSQTPSGLVAAYGFNEGIGVEVTDASGQANTGSSATWTATGKFGGALSFNGTSSWVTVADAASLDLTTGMTIEAWVSPAAGTGWRTVILKEDAGGLAFALSSANNASRPAGYVHTNTDVGIKGTSAVPLNSWTHLALTFDGATLRMFVNGVQVSSSAVAGAAVVTSSALRIGGNAVWGEYFRGLIDKVRIYTGRSPRRRFRPT